MPKMQKFQLKDQSTTFFDPETRLKVTGKDIIEIDGSQRKGKLTLAAINAGGLVEVKTEAASKKDAGGKDKEPAKPTK